MRHQKLHKAKYRYSRNLHKKIGGWRYLILFLMCIYIVIGISTVGDYSVSTDEPNERRTMYINLNYITTLLGKEPMDVPELDSYVDKYYGIFLQMPTALFEVGHKGLDYIYHCRHLYTFCVCMMGYIAFYYLCQKIFSSYWVALLGTAMIALYPRFFAEQFYNIKDMFFVAAYMLAMWATYMVIEGNFTLKRIVIFSIMTALATNVRIVGIVFVILLLGYMWAACILEKIYAAGYYTLTCKKTLSVSIAIIIFYFVFLVLMYPVAWENPVRTIVEIFTKFSNYDDWSGAIVFMGKIISKEELPWNYIPVWMLISIPIWYILLFLMTGILAVWSVLSKIKKKNILVNLFFQYKYFIWCILLVIVPMGTILVKHATLYSGWRHCYFLLPPLVLFALYGVDHIIKKGKKGCMIAVFLLIILGITLQVRWICINHPYEMVYFNSIGKTWASDFDRDYWHMAELQAYEWIMENDDNDKITINSSGTLFFLNLLSGEQRERVEKTQDPMYFIETYRGKVGNEVEIDGYEEIYSIVVDNFKVASVFQKKA
ncbi:hypothetical protein IMSAG249_00391 [Lachnospiraceae bacterium]|nr:hypothetical protein IMSAG249_00391 [Lachnospiraceae bacterium]